MMGLLGTLYEACDTDPSLCEQLQTLPEVDKSSAVERVRAYAGRCASGDCELSELLETLPPSIASLMSQPRYVSTSCFEGNVTLAQATQICTVLQVEATKRSRANGCQTGCIVGVAAGTVAAAILATVVILFLLSQWGKRKDVVEISKETETEVPDEPASADKPRLSM